MANTVESKWCPECEGWYDHLDGFCIGCDLDEKHWGGKAPKNVDVQAALGNKDWMGEKWLVVKDVPMLAADTKREVTTLLSEELGTDVSTERVTSGLYAFDHSEDTFYIGRPETLDEHDFINNK